MKVLVALAVLFVAAQAATTNFYQPISFQPTNQEIHAVHPILPVPEPEYHEINVPHYDGAPLVIIKVNVKKVAQPQPEPEAPIFQTLPAFIPADYLRPVPAFSPADLAKPAPIFHPADLVKPLYEDDNAPAAEIPFENEWASEHIPQEVQAGPLVKIIVNIDN